MSTIVITIYYLLATVQVKLTSTNSNHYSVLCLKKILFSLEFRFLKICIIHHNLFRNSQWSPLLLSSLPKGASELENVTLPDTSNSGVSKGSLGAKSGPPSTAKWPLTTLTIERKTVGNRGIWPLRICHPSSCCGGWP